MRRPQRVPPGVESQSHARRGEICEWCRPAADRIIAINALGCVEADEHAPIGVDGEVLGKGADRPRRYHADIDGREGAAIMLDISFRLSCFIHEPIYPRGRAFKIHWRFLPLVIGYSPLR